MSYTILYRSMFVKLSNGKYIPMVETGDNNTYTATATGQKRSRDWQQWIIGKNYKGLAYTAEEIMGYVESVIDEEKREHVNKPKNIYKEDCNEYWTYDEIERNLGYFTCIAVSGRHCNDTSAQQVRNFFRRGMEQAVSFEADNLTLDLHWCSEYPNYEHRYVTSEQELMEAWQTLHAEGKKTIWIDFGGYAVERLWETHRHKAPAREKKQTVLTAQTLSRVMSYSDYEKIAKEGDRVLVMASDLTRTSIWSRKKVYTVVRTNDPDGTILRKHGGRNSVYFPRDSWSYGCLMAAILTDEEYKKLAA